MFDRQNTETPTKHRPWRTIFRAMHALSDAGVRCEDAYAVLKVEALAVSTDESGNAVFPKRTAPTGRGKPPVGAKPLVGAR